MRAKCQVHHISIKKFTALIISMENSLLESYPVVVEIPVAWGEMDSFQHVNNVVYFRYFESARIAYSEKIGLQKHKEKTGIGPILGSTSCKYKLPLTYPDTVSVGAKVTGMEEDRFMMSYVIMSHRHQKIAAEGDGLVVMYDYNDGRKTAIPDEIRLRIQEIEER
jgi:acyl-CoA thioester hydrolase